MAKKTKSEAFKFEIVEFIGTLKESDRHDWCKSIARISWNDDPATLDIRNMNLSDHRIGKGISLTDEEADKLINILLENDYGTLELLEQAVTKKRNRFTISKDTNTHHDIDDKYMIDIKL